MRQLLSSGAIDLGSTPADRWTRTNAKEQLGDLGDLSLKDLALEGLDFSHLHMPRTEFLTLRIESCLFHNSTLNNLRVEGSEIHDSSFGGAKLKYAKLTKTLLYSCDFLSADLTAADFEKATFEDCELSGCDLGAARLDWAKLSDVRLREARFYTKSVAPGYSFRDQQFRALGASLSKCDLTGALFRGADLRQLKMAETIIKDTSFHDVDLFHGELVGCELDGGKIDRSQGEAIRVQGGTIANTLVSWSTFKKARFKPESTSDTKFDTVSLDGTTFGGSFERVIFERCGLRGVSFRDAQLIGVLFKGDDHHRHAPRFVNCRFSEVTFDAVELPCPICGRRLEAGRYSICGEPLQLDCGRCGAMFIDPDLLNEVDYANRGLLSFGVRETCQKEPSTVITRALLREIEADWKLPPPEERERRLVDWLVAESPDVGAWMRLEWTMLSAIGCSSLESLDFVAQSLVDRGLAEFEPSQGIGKRARVRLSPKGWKSDQPRPEEHEGPLRILFLASNPGSTTRLDLEEEVRGVESELRGVKHRSTIDLVVGHAVRPDDLVRLLREEEPSIVHFSGHASADGIVLRSEAGSSLVTGAALERLFRGRGVRLVVLNACYTSAQATSLQAVVPAVVGTTRALNDEAARRFSVAFYRTLGNGHTVQDAFRDGGDSVALHNLPDVYHAVGAVDDTLVG